MKNNTLLIWNIALTLVVAFLLVKQFSPAKVADPVEMDQGAEVASLNIVYVNADTLLEKFTSLIDKDYDSALTLLEEYGVKTFNDLDKEQYNVFGRKVDELLGG